jgi:hypothetical protein
MASYSKRSVDWRMIVDQTAVEAGVYFFLYGLLFRSFCALHSNGSRKRISFFSLESPISSGLAGAGRTLFFWETPNKCLPREGGEAFSLKKMDSCAVT